MPGQTINLNELLPLKSGEWIKKVMGAGDDNMVVVLTCSGLFMVHLKSLQFENDVLWTLGRPGPIAHHPSLLEIRAAHFCKKLPVIISNRPAVQGEVGI
jgi:hypothetical protein